MLRHRVLPSVPHTLVCLRSIILFRCYGRLQRMQARGASVLLVGNSNFRSIGFSA